MFRRSVSLLLFLSLLFLFGCSEQRSFSHAELTLTLTDDFTEVESEGYDLALRSDKVSVGVIRISLAAAENSGIPDTMSPEDFALYTLKEKRGEGACDVYSYKDIPYFTLYEAVGGREYYTLYTFFRSVHAYFILTLAVPRADEAEYRETLFEYADSVIFTPLS